MNLDTFSELGDWGTKRKGKHGEAFPSFSFDFGERLHEGPHSFQLEIRLYKSHEMPWAKNLSSNTLWRQMMMMMVMRMVTMIRESGGAADDDIIADPNIDLRTRTRSCTWYLRPA
jgi:hypothetical protein